MARAPELTTLTTSKERQAFARRLREAARVLDEFDETVEGADSWIFRVPSIVDGLRRVESFVEDLRRTTNYVVSGRELTKRSTKADLT